MGVIKAGNIIVGNVGVSSAPTLPASVTTDKIVVSNLQELRGATQQPSIRAPRVAREPTPSKVEPVNTNKKRVSKYLADMYDTVNLPSFDEDDK